MSHHSFSKQEVKIPSKTFLMGEYAVLDGFRALVITHGPYFFCSSSNRLEGVSFHKNSPAGRLEMDLSKTRNKWNFKDPHSGAGGFGGSTAEFISVYKALNPEGTLEDLRKRYFSLFEGQSVAPSGADLTAQFKEEASCLVYSKEPFSFEHKEWPFENVELLILKTNTKLETHKHLESLKKIDKSKLGAISELAIEAFCSRDLEIFIKSVDDFAKAQSELGLLSLETQESAEAISKINGVFTVRGCGAMGADVITVFVKKGSLDYVWSQVEILKRGLKKVSPG